MEAGCDEHPADKRGCCKITEVQNQLWSNSSFLLPEYSKRQAPKRLPVV